MIEQTGEFQGDTLNKYFQHFWFNPRGGVDATLRISNRKGGQVVHRLEGRSILIQQYLNLLFYE